MIKVLILGSKEIDTINKAYIFDIYQELCFSEKELEEKLHQVKWLKCLGWCKKAAENINNDFRCDFFSLEDAVGYLSTSDFSGVLTSQKYASALQFYGRQEPYSFCMVVNAIVLLSLIVPSLVDCIIFY